MLRSQRLSSNPIDARLAYFVPKVTSAIVIGMSCLVLLGWLFDITVFKSVMPDFVTMKANTAIAFLSAGIALGATQRQLRQLHSTRLQAIAQGCAGVTAIIGVLTLSQYIFDINVGIDQLLFQESSTAVGTSHPGRMAPLTATNFVLLGTALLLVSRQIQTHARIAQILTLLAGLLTLQALVGYVYKVEVFYGIGSYTQMALHTALTFIGLCSGILFLNPNQGLIRILTSPTISGFLGRRLFFSAIAIPLGVGWLVMQGHQKGFYTAKLGFSLLVILSIIALSVLIWWSINSLEQLDAERLGTVQALQNSEASRRELAQVQEAFRRSESIFRSYFELSLVGIAIISPEKGWIEVNDELCKILGYSQVELCQMTWVELTHPDDLQTDLECFNRVMQGEQEGYSLDKRFIRKNGEIVHASISTRCSRRRDGSIDYFVALVQNISERVQNEIERRKADAERVKLTQEQTARAEAEAANLMKDEFLAILSHELRTPLNAILGWTRLLRSRQFNPDASLHALETIERNAEIQAQLIDDILDVSCIVQGQLSLNLCPIDLVLVLESAINSIRPDIEAKAIALTLTIAQAGNYPALTLPLSSNKHSSLLSSTQSIPERPIVLGDPRRLQQIIWNLLSNAVKFTDKGGQINIKLSWGSGDRTKTASPGELNNSAEIVVKDTGKGIRPDFLPHVFERFRQADSSTTRSHGGLGLGLAIVYHLVELHQGTIEVASPGEGQGATFTVRLPLLNQTQNWSDAKPFFPQGDRSTNIADSAQSVSRSSPPSLFSISKPLPSAPQVLSKLTGVHILIVDATATTRDALKQLLKQEGAIVTAVASATSALDLLDQVEVDVLISDLEGLPIEGHRLIHSIRQRSSQEGGLIGAIALVSASAADSQFTATSNYQHYLTKPVKSEELVQAIVSLTHLG